MGALVWREALHFEESGNILPWRPYVKLKNPAVLRTRLRQIDIFMSIVLSRDILGSTYMARKATIYVHISHHTIFVTG